MKQILSVESGKTSVVHTIEEDDVVILTASLQGPPGPSGAQGPPGTGGGSRAFAFFIGGT